MGAATVSVRYGAWSSTGPVTAAVADQPYRVPLTLTPVSAEEVEVQWPAYAPGAPESGGDKLGASWTELFLPSTIAGDQRSMIVPSTNRAGFFRIQP